VGTGVGGVGAVHFAAQSGLIPAGSGHAKSLPPKLHAHWNEH
jgi:hypothetical protein